MNIQKEIKDILQRVHDDACRPNHDPRLGYSIRAYDDILSLIDSVVDEVVGKDVDPFKADKKLPYQIWYKACDEIENELRQQIREKYQLMKKDENQPE